MIALLKQLTRAWLFNWFGPNDRDFVDACDAIRWLRLDISRMLEPYTAPEYRKLAEERWLCQS